MGNWREHTYEQMYHEYYILGNYTTTFIRYSFFSTEKSNKRKNIYHPTASAANFFLFLFWFLREWRTKQDKDNPNPQYLNKTKIITFYIYHHIDTQPFESHLAARTPPAHLDHDAPRSSSLLGCFSCFYRYWQMKRQVFQTCLHSFTIIYLLWFVNCVLTTWPTVLSNL